MVIQSIWISLPIFYTQASSSIFYKINNSFNHPLETSQHWNHYLPIQLFTYLSFVINLKESVHHPVKQIEYLGQVIDGEKMAFSEKKLKACVSKRSEDFYAIKNFSFNSHKGNQPVKIYCPGHFSGTNSIFIFSAGANINSTKKRGLTLVMGHWGIQSGSNSFGIWKT